MPERSWNFAIPTARFPVGSPRTIPGPRRTGSSCSRRPFVLPGGDRQRISDEHRISPRRSPSELPGVPAHPRAPATLVTRRKPMNPARVPGPAGALAVDDGGRGELPVLLVHSLAGNSAQWSVQLEHLRATRRAIALDLRGHGRSEPPKNGDYSMSGMAGDIEAVVNALGIEK